MIFSQNGHLIIFAVIFLGFAGSKIAKKSNNDVSFNKKGKFWTMGLVRIENSVCIGIDGLIGTCYTRWQCKSIGGILSGRCHGVGTCCVVQQTCGTIAAYNNTYFVNPGFPATYAGGSTCTITIQKCHADICQVRLDFLCLTLAQPNDQGVCITDALYITGGASLFTPICGDNNGQHVYMNFNGAEDIRITIVTNTAVTLNRSWKILISQIPCGCPTTAPTGCLMFYTAVTGTVKSFNYGITAPDIATGTRQIANTNYGICVQMRPGYCSIRWTQSAGDLFAFTVTGDTIAATAGGIVGTPGAAGTDCTTDYIIIPNPVGLTTDRFCGNGLNPAAIVTFSKPFVLTTVTNDNEDGDVGNRGFSLTYQQVLCGADMVP